MSADSSSTLPQLTLILGGQRSGKSAYGEGLIGSDQQAIYLATGQALDEEMTARVALHRKRRGANWTTVEEPLALEAALQEHDQEGRPVLIDSLAMWVCNLLDSDTDVESEIFALVEALKRIKSPVIVVSDEAGLGVIPDNVLGRNFLDQLGAVNQRVASHADRVVFVAAGLPMVLKG